MPNTLTPSERALYLSLRSKKNAPAREARKRARKLSPKGDRGRERNNAYLAWLRRQPCCLQGGPGCDGPVQAAHLRYGDSHVGRINPGLQKKSSDRWATPLCTAHHAEQHAAGDERRWWASYGLDGSAVAARYFAAFEADNGEIVRKEER